MLNYLQFRNQSLNRLPLFVGADGQALTAGALVKFTQSLIEKANIPNAHLFLGYSFHKGGATSLHEAGMLIINQDNGQRVPPLLLLTLIHQCK